MKLVKKEIIVFVVMTIMISVFALYNYAWFSSAIKNVKDSNVQIKTTKNLKGTYSNLESNSNGVDGDKCIKDEVLTIKCIGDSVTEGMGLPDAHKAEVGGESYPSILYTMLSESGVNATVENAGHGGEDTASIVARLGGTKLYLTDNLVFDKDGISDCLDGLIVADYGSDLYMPVNFSCTATDLNPIVINGINYKAVRRLGANNEYETYLTKSDLDSEDFVLAGSEVQITVSRHNSVNVIFAGINDDNNISFNTYIEILKKGIKASGDDYIILGPHINYYYREGFLKGSTSEERHESYVRRMEEEFGERFVDLNTLWFERAFPVALEKGYLVGMSSEERNIIKDKLSKKIVPAEFTVNNKENGVHLNEVGYAILAEIVYDKLEELGYF